MKFLTNPLLQIIRHQIYRSLFLLFLVCGIAVIMLPKGFIQENGLLSLQRLIYGEIGHSSQTYQFEKLTLLALDDNPHSQFEYYIGTNNDQHTLIKTYKNELSPIKTTMNKKSKILQSAGTITEALGNYSEKPKVSLFGKLINITGEAIEEYTLTIRGYNTSTTSTLVSDFDRQLLTQLNQNDRIIISPKIYYIPTIFWLLPFAFLLFIIDAIYLAMRAFNLPKYLTNHANRYNTHVSFSKIDEEFDQAYERNQLYSLPEGVFTQNYLFITRLTKFYLIRFSDILTFSESSGEILLKRRRFPVNLKLSESSIHQITQFIHEYYPEIITKQDQVKPYRETHEVQQTSLWGDIWRGALTEIGIMIIMLIIFAIVLLPYLAAVIYVLPIIFIILVIAFFFGGGF